MISSFFLGEKTILESYHQLCVEGVCETAAMERVVKDYHRQYPDIPRVLVVEFVSYLIADRKNDK